MNSISLFLSSTGTVGFGFIQTARGLVEAGSGKIYEGAKKIFLGLAATHAGAKFFEIGRTFPGVFMKKSLQFGCLLNACSGIEQTLDGMNQKDSWKATAGLFKATVGLAAVTEIQRIGIKEITDLHIPASLATVSALLAYLGIQDLKKGKFLKGTGELLLGAAGICSAAYYAFSSLALNDPSPPAPVPEYVRNFAQKFNDLPEDECVALDGGEFVACGWSKCVYTHPDLPGYVIKVSNQNIQSFSESLENHYNNGKNIQSLISKWGYRHIVVPDMHLINSNILLEERFQFQNYQNLLPCQEKIAAEEEYSEILKDTGLFDVDLQGGHNAHFLEKEDDSAPLQIALYDFNNVDTLSWFRN